MDLSTNYLGLKLKHPIILGASPLAHDVDQAKQIADAGASAIVMHSLFEEQILLEESAQQAHVTAHENTNAEATDFVPKPGAYTVGPEEYLELLHKVKSAVDIPVIGSLNGVTNSGWLDYAKRIQQAGADALELNDRIDGVDSTLPDDLANNRDTQGRVKYDAATTPCTVIIYMAHR